MAYYFLISLGCKANQYDSAAIGQWLLWGGHLPTASPAQADLLVVQTCCVTSTAMQKSRSTLRRILRQRPGAVVLVSGCYGQYDAHSVRRVLSESGVSPDRGFVVGNHSDLGAVLRQVNRSLEEQPGGTSMPQSGLGGSAGLFRDEQCMSAGNSCCETASPQTPSIKARRIAAVKRNITTNEFLPIISSFPGHQRAFVKVQDGCDAFCSYCVVPYVRAVLWWRPVQDVRTQCEAMVKSGHREIVLSGIFLGAYGRSTAIRRRWPRTPSVSAGLPDLVRAVRDVPGLWRLRLSSLEPLDLSDELLEACSHRAVAPHFHLPLQSGSGAILAKMNRQYTPDQYRHCVTRLRRTMEHPSITTDIIVGFPGETEEDFEQTLEMARWAGFSKIHAFPFSAIEGTVAWLWRKSAPSPPVVRDRMSRLAALELELATAYRGQFIGRTIEALVEKHAPRTARGGYVRPLRQRPRRRPQPRRPHRHNRPRANRLAARGGMEREACAMNCAGGTESLTQVMFRAGEDVLLHG